MPDEVSEVVSIIAAGFIFNIIETAWFGWNLRPSCPQEMICDTICGEWSTYISQDHAHRHGYKNADEMARAGVMHWTE